MMALKDTQTLMHRPSEDANSNDSRRVSIIGNDRSWTNKLSARVLEDHTNDPPTNAISHNLEVHDTLSMYLANNQLQITSKYVWDTEWQSNPDVVRSRKINVISLRSTQIRSTHFDNLESHR